MSNQSIKAPAKNQINSFDIEFDKVDFIQSYPVKVHNIEENENVDKMITIETITDGYTKTIRVSERNMNSRI